MKTEIDGHWLVDRYDHHTCGTGPDGYYGIHEPWCGTEPVVDLRGLSGWDSLVAEVRTITPDQREAAARAIYEAERSAALSGGLFCLDWPATPTGKLRERYLARADAVIEVLRFTVEERDHV